MADFVAVLRKTITGLGETTPEIREKVYQKARNTIEAKLAALVPPPPAAAADRQRQALEDAIRTLEAEYAPPQPDTSDPLNELDELFHELATTKPSERAHGDDAAVSAEADKALVEHEPWFKPVADDEPDDHVSDGVVAGAADRTVPEDETVLGAETGRMEEDEPAAVDNAVAVDEAAAIDIASENAVPEESDHDVAADDQHAAPRRSRAGWVIAGIVLLLAAAGGYAAWLNRDSISELVAGLQQDGVTANDAATSGDADTTTSPTEPDAPGQDAQQPENSPATPESTAPASGEPEDGAAADGPEKFTQRLMPDGSEIDPGPAGEEAGSGEGTSVAASTPSDTSEPSEAASQGVPVGQKAIFYEERTNVAEGSAETGSVVWSLVQESPGGDLPPEPAVRAEATIPGRDLQLRMTIRRNGDESLPASHIVELIFLAPDGFGDGGIDNVLRMTLKDTEEATGNPLMGIPAKIADGFFLIALNDGETEVEANTALMRRQNWIDLPVVYKSGRRALITMEKGIPGERVFDEALRAWQSASSG